MLCLAILLALEIPEPLESALARQQPVEQFVSGRLRVTEGEATIEFQVVYDETGEASVTLLAPAEAALSDAEAALWAGWQGDDDDEEEEPDAPRTFGLYSPAALRASIGDAARFEREEDGLLVYSFDPHSLVTPDGEEDADEIIAHLAGTVAVDPAAGHVAWIEYAAPESFKPNMAARIERFSMRTGFTGSPAGPRLARMHLELAGSAMFQNFDQTTLIELIEAEFAPAD